MILSLTKFNIVKHSVGALGAMQLQVVSVGSLATTGSHRVTGKVPMAAKSMALKPKKEGDAASKRKDISCMITSLKNSKDTSKAQLLAK